MLSDERKLKERDREVRRARYEMVVRFSAPDMGIREDLDRILGVFQKELAGAGYDGTFSCDVVDHGA